MEQESHASGLLIARTLIPVTSLGIHGGKILKWMASKMEPRAMVILL
jgi:hypothetical protein